MDAQDVVDDVLKHHGVKGMHWGVRKPKPLPNGEVVLSKKLKNGEKLVVRKKTYDDTCALYKMVSSRKKFNKDRLEAPQFLLTDKHGKRVGEAGFYRSYQHTLELEWIGVNKDQRRKGYAKAAMEGVIKYAKSEGITKLNLTATDMGRPLYESLGFKKATDGDYHTMEIAGVVKHSTVGGFSDASIASLADFISTAIDSIEEVNMDAQDVVDDVLKHHGVKGMRWGVRRGEASASSGAASGPKASRKGGVSQINKKSVGLSSDDAKKANSAHAKAKEHGTASLSNQELQHLVNRMNLEQQYTRLQTTGSKSGGASFAKKLLADVGKQQLSKLANEQAAKHIALMMAKSAAGR